jgi:hypothetical protein
VKIRVISQHGFYSYDEETLQQTWHRLGDVVEVPDRQAHTGIAMQMVVPASVSPSEEPE